MTSKIMVSAVEGARIAFSTSERNFHEMRKRPGFPKPVVLGPRCIRWFLNELEGYARSLPRKDRSLEPDQLFRSRSQKAEASA